MTDNLIPADSVTGDNIKPGTNGAKEPCEQNPEGKLTLANQNKSVWSRLTTLEWCGFAVDVYVTLWIWSDIIGCHEVRRLLFLAVSLLFAHGVLAAFLSKVFNSKLFGFIAWGVLSVAAAVMAVNNAPAPKGLVLEKPSSILLVMGSSSMELDVQNATREHPLTPTSLKINGSLLPLRLYVEDDRLFCDVELSPIRGMPPIKLEHNALSGRPQGWDLNQNERGIEIVNQQQVPVFQLYYLDDSQICLKGAFNNEKSFFVIGDDGVFSLPPQLESKFLGGTKCDWAGTPVKITLLFKHPGSKYPGKLQKPK